MKPRTIEEARAICEDFIRRAERDERDSDIAHGNRVLALINFAGRVTEAVMNEVDLLNERIFVSVGIGSPFYGPLDDDISFDRAIHVIEDGGF